MKRRNIVLIIGIITILMSMSIFTYVTNYIYTQKEEKEEIKGKENKLYHSQGYNEIRELIYPVGSIYMSVEDDTVAKVEERFGGEWEVFGAGRTIVAMGNNGTTNYTQVEKIDGTESQSYTPAGSDSGFGVSGGNITYTPAGTNSGGAVGNHTLTIAEMPSHSHSWRGYYTTYIMISTGTRGQVMSRSNISGDPLDTKFVNTGGGGAHNHPFTQPKFTGTKATLTHTHTVTQPTFKGTAATISHMQPYITVYMYKRVS